MTEGSQKIFEFLKKNYGKSFTVQNICDETDVHPSVVNGFILGNRKKGFIEVEEKIIPPSTFPKKVISLTEVGYNYDPYDEEKKKKEERLRLKSEKRKERYIKNQEKLVEFYGGKHRNV